MPKGMKPTDETLGTKISRVEHFVKVLCKHVLVNASSKIKTAHSTKPVFVCIT